MVGIDPDTYDTSQAFTNTSLGVAEASFLRRLNLALDDEVGWPLYNEMVKHHLAQDVLVNRPGQRGPAHATRRRRLGRRTGDRLVERLATAGYDIVGTLDDLRPTAARRPPAPPPGLRRRQRDDRSTSPSRSSVALLVEDADPARASSRRSRRCVRALAATAMPIGADPSNARRGAAG